MIAIKDMEMPSCCATCHVSEVDCKHKKTAFVRYSREDFAIPSDCPLVEIVTCKDCKYWKFDENKSILCGYCSDLETETNEDFYCADAERNEKTSRAEELRKITEAAYEGNEVETGEQNNDSWC